MKVYQLKLDDLDMVLDPVYKTEEGAKMAMIRYFNRKVSIVESALDNICDYVYRIAEVSDDGISLDSKVFETLESAKSYSSENNLVNSKLMKENIINGNHDYELIEV